MKIAVLINKLTGELDGITIVSVDSDIDFVQPTETHDVLHVAPDHPAIHEQLQWEAPKRVVFGAQWDRVLKRKEKL